MSKYLHDEMGTLVDQLKDNRINRLPVEPREQRLVRGESFLCRYGDAKRASPESLVRSIADTQMAQYLHEARDLFVAATQRDDNDRVDELVALVDVIVTVSLKELGQRHTQAAVKNMAIVIDALDEVGVKAEERVKLMSSSNSFWTFHSSPSASSTATR